MEGLAGPDSVEQGLQLRGRGALDQARHQHPRQIQGTSQPRTRRSVTGHGTAA